MIYKFITIGKSVRRMSETTRYAGTTTKGIQNRQYVENVHIISRVAVCVEMIDVVYTYHSVKLPHFACTCTRHYRTQAHDDTFFH